ncbi:paxneb superfamily protein [Geopyxis carbonaria]|nr:paxneb superfamily protein [Geopyxis carbonaria]
MSFRKRNVVIGARHIHRHPSLDSLLAGHSGLALGCSLLIEEPGTTDYGGALLRYYAAEGIMQSHTVTVVGFSESWVRSLPGVTGDASLEKPSARPAEGERMKIAWRYERLGEFGSGIGGSRAQSASPRDPTAPQDPSSVFCHAYDLTKRLSIPGGARLNFIPPPSAAGNPAENPFHAILKRLDTLISAEPAAQPHRIVIPSLLNPALYPPHAAAPQNLIQFIHALRALLRIYPRKLTIMISLPTELYPRDTGLIRWVEILSDGVMELLPLPRWTAAKASAGDNKPQGLVKMYKLPVLGDKGGGVGAIAAGGEDLAFLVTRKMFEIMAYSLPPADAEEGDGNVDRPGAIGHEKKATAVDIEF